jgi:hypothetical protein
VNQNDLCRIHCECYKEESEYIPLAVKVSANPISEYTQWESMKKPQKTIDTFLQNNKISIRICSDRITVIESNFLESLIPSLFGADIYQSSGESIEARPFINDITETASMEVKDLFTGQTEEALLHLRYLRKNPIENVRILMSRKGGRGIAATVTVPDAASGQELCDLWTEYFHSDRYLFSL